MTQPPRESKSEPEQEARNAELAGLQSQIAELERRLDAAHRQISTLKGTEKRYSELLRISPYGVLVQENGRITYINDRGMQILGASSAAEVLGREPKEFIRPDQSDLFWARDHELSTSGQTAPSRFVLQRCDGTSVEVDVASVRLELEKGYAIQTVFQDVSEQLRLEEELRQAAERYRIIDELSSDYIYLDRIDEEGRMHPLWVTSAFERMTGYTVEEAQQPDLLEKLAHPDDLQPFMEHYQRLLQLQQGDFVGRLIRKDGEQRWVRHIARPVHSGSGRTSLLYGCVRDITEWMEAEQQAQEYSRRYQIISELSEDFHLLGCMHADGYLEVLWVTNAFERMTGYTLDDTRDPAFVSCLLPDDPEHSLLLQIDAIKARVPSVAEGPMQTKWGAKLWVRSTVRPYDDERSGKTMVFASVRDITRRRMAEEALRESEQQLRVAQRIGMIGSWQFDFLEWSLLWSAQMYAIFGVDPETFTPGHDSFMALVHPDDRDNMQHQMQVSLESGSSYDVEFRIQRPDGSLRYIHSRAEMEANAAGIPLRMIGTCQDVTAEHEKEQALQLANVALEASNSQLQSEIAERLAAVETLRQSEERYRRLLESMEEGVILADFDERHLYANPAAERIYGVGPGELVSRPITDFIDKETLELFRSETLLRRSGAHSVYDFEIIRPDGERRRLRNSVSPVRSATGEVIASMGVFTDITEQEQLRQRLLGEQREESVVMLAGGIAHDFNNMLTGVLGASMLIESSLPQDAVELRELAQVISTSATRMADLTGKLLAYARGGKYQTRRVDLNQCVSNVCVMARGKLPARVQIELDLDEKLPTIEADMGQIEQVLLNLLINAIEAIESSGREEGVIRITTSKDSISAADKNPAAARLISEAVRVTVQDNGCGMSAETLKQVFEPFFSTKSQGRGLGLAACSGIVRNHEGMLYAESKSGHGSQFHMLLPASKQQEPVASEKPDEEQHVSAGSCILLVDDDPDALIVIARMLESRGYRVRKADGGLAGLQAWQAGRSEIDLIILDMQMPDMSGAELLRQIRSEDQSVPVLMSSGYAAEDAINALHGQLHSGFLSKPFSPRQLIQGVEAALASTPARSA
jgi:PAS domain S-box-containing protein